MTIGEILDRAISTYVRRALPFFVILAIAVVPAALIQLAAMPGFAHTADLFAQLNRLPPAAAVERNHLLAQALGSVNPGALFAIFFLGPLVLFPLSRNAIFIYADAKFDGAPISIAAAYRRAAGRWAPQVVTVIAYFAIAMTVGIAVVFAGTVAATVGFFAFGRGTGGVLAALVVAVPLVVAAASGAALLNVAFELSSVSVALEERNPIRAIGNGWRRTFDPTLRRRNFSVALAYSAVEFAGNGALLALSALLDVFVQVVLSATVQILITGALAVFVILYSRDVRLRREGLDLLAAGSSAAAGDVDPNDGLEREDRALIEQYLARRASLDGNASAAIAAAIAARIRPKLRADFHYLDDTSLIEHIARSRR